MAGDSRFSNYLEDGDQKEVEISFDFDDGITAVNAGFRWVDGLGANLIWMTDTNDEDEEIYDIDGEVYLLLLEYATDCFLDLGYEV